MILSLDTEEKVIGYNNSRMAKEINKEFSEYSFPEDFLWGASTSGHQVEGGNYNQWTVYEQSHASELARSAEKRLHWLPEWEGVRNQAEEPGNYVSGKGVDHYRRYKEDFTIIKELGLNAFRFGIEWSRLEPEAGVWNKIEIDHYHNYIAELKKLGIEPVLNLWHWTQPVWFEELGGFSQSGNIKHFIRFVRKVTEEYGDEVKYILTINEPNVYSSLSYLIGEWPPLERNIIKFVKTYYNLARAHNQAYRTIKEINQNIMVGPATQYNNAQPKRPNHLLDKLVARLSGYFWNWWWTNRIRKNIDFIGFNYYFTDYFYGFRRANPTSPHNDLGWYMDPSGLEVVLKEAWGRYGVPIMVTENGLADANDRHRQWWLEETMKALAEARAGGVDVFGYMHWSLLDNFEWKYGWWPKFGLVKVDRENGMKRIVRPSAVWWSKMLKSINRK